MGSLLSKYKLSQMNKDLNYMIQHNRINTLKAFVLKDESKLSVTLSPRLKYNEEYHGLHPSFNEEKLRHFLSSKINDSDCFWNLVGIEQRINEYFNLIVDDDASNIINEDFFQLLGDTEFKIAMLGRAILQMTSHFGFRIKCSDQALLDSFCDEIFSICNIQNYPAEMFLKANGQLGYIELLNIWPIDMIEQLAKSYDITILEQGELHLISCNEIQQENLLKQILCFKKIQYLELLTSEVYYSGVMPRVMKVSCNDNKVANSNIKFFTFEVSRTTFATVDLMDNSKILSHPFFTKGINQNNKLKMMLEFDHHEDLVQSKYLYVQENVRDAQINQREFEYNEINNINNYLLSSLNTHTIAVSSNIITSDNFLIVAKRSGRSIDAGEYYCSANGQSEFMDKNVSFYKESVFEDLPSMDYNSEYRVDLNNEIRREVIAELGVTVLDSDWKYYGVSYLGINNFKNISSDNISLQDSKKIINRRMHFNVLTSNRTPLDFKTVISNQKYATENFENSNILGLKTIVFKDKAEFMSRIFIYGYNWIDRNKSRAFLILFFISFVISRTNDQKLNLDNIVDISLLFVYLFFTLNEVIKNRRVRKLKVTKYYYLPRFTKYTAIDMIKVFDKLSKKVCRKDKYAFHGIFRVMYILYLINDDYKS